MEDRIAGAAKQAKRCRTSRPYTSANRMLVDAVRKGREARLRGLRDLDAAALTLSKACVLVLDGTVNDGE